MWTYQQSTGHLFNPTGQLLGVGYSGHGDGKNQPTMQNVADVGPLPQGKYTIGPPHTDPKLGPVAMSLTPDPANDMFMRSAFWCHGENLTKPPGTSSEGCIVIDRSIRLQMALSLDRDLEVVA